MPYCDVWAENNNTEVGMYAQPADFDANLVQNRLVWFIIRFIPTFSVFSFLLFLKNIYANLLYINDL